MGIIHAEKCNLAMDKLKLNLTQHCVDQVVARHQADRYVYL
jgi:hypothetical protein